MSETVSREEFEALQKRVESMSLGKKPKRTRAPTPYNLFVGKESTRIRGDNPEMKQKEAFTQACKNWATSSENPKYVPEEKKSKK
jgi:hypothetical protein